MAPNIQTQSKDHQAQQQEETHRYGFFHHGIAHFAACDDFPNKEHYITAVERRDGEQVHKSQNDA